MSYRPTTPTNSRRTRSPNLAALVVVSVAISVVAGYQLMAASSSWATPHLTKDPGPSRTAGTLHGSAQDARGEAGGAVPDGTTVFDDRVPGVANLDPDLLGALRSAAADAADDGVELIVNSGWRSRAYQERLLAEAVAKYGSREEAARWVATPDTSPHVSGDAVDLGPSEATAWLSEHGAAYGLCQIFANEPWHYELRPEAIEHGCPPMYADAAHDPRMQG